MVEAQVFQIYYLTHQKDFLDPDFIPFDNQKNPDPKWCEFGVMWRSFQNNLILKDKLSGFVSWKFQHKTGLKGSSFLKFIKQNPGFDFYFVNPFPAQTEIYENVWQQGEFYHPGLTAAAQNLFNRAGYPIELKTLKNSPSDTVYCNYWVGSFAFWEAYIEFCRPLYELVEKGLSFEEKEILLANADLNIKAPLLAFIQERLISTFLLQKAAAGFKTCAYTYSEEELKKHFADDVIYYEGLKVLNSMLSGKIPHDPVLLSQVQSSFRKLLQEHWRLKQETLKFQLMQNFFRKLQKSSPYIYHKFKKFRYQIFKALGTNNPF